jgi:photosystem II stability/assembly factor-like uncharacterized protein
MVKLTLIILSVFLIPFSALTQGWYWQNPLPQGNTPLAVCSVDENTWFAATNGGTVLHTANGGKSWTSLETGAGHPLSGISFSDNKNGTVVGDYGVIMRTTDGGVTWLDQSIPGYTEFLFQYGNRCRRIRGNNSNH